MFALYSAQEVNTVMFSDKNERVRIANISFIVWVVGLVPEICSFSKTPFNHSRFPVTFQNI